MIKIAITGAAGRMGIAILKAVKDNGEYIVTNVFENPDSNSIGLDAGERAGTGKLGILIEGSLKPGDYQVIVDFTTPRASVDIAKFAADNKISLVIGTTGFKNEQMNVIEQCSKKIPCVISPNMSVGINLLYYLIEEAVKILGTNYDCEIIESHHNKKKDAPSGTAKKFAEIVSRLHCNEFETQIIHGRYGFYPERSKEEVGIHSIRAGNIVGEHNVLFAGSDEVIELVHRAGSRNTFAHGALKAAKFACDVPPGFYTMADVLKLPKV